MKFQASLPTVSCVLAYPRFPAIMLWGPLPSLICVYVAVCLSLPWFQPLPCQETGIPLWPSVTGWPVAFHICVHTPTPDQNSTLTICCAVQDAAAVVLKRKIIEDRKQRELGTEWFAACLILTRDFHIWFIVLSSLCLSDSLFSLPFPPSLLSLSHRPYSSFQLRLGPNMEEGQSTFALVEGEMRFDKWLRMNRL